MTKAFQKLLSILFIICCPTTIFASEVTVVTAHLAPFQIVNSTSITGLSTEIVKATLDVSGLDYNIEAYEWSLSFNRARQEPNVCIYSLARIPARNTLFHWVGHITSSMVSLYSLANNSLFIDNIDDAKKHMTAVIKDDVIHHYLLDKGFEEGKNLYVMSNYDALLKFLETPSRGIDLIAINDDLINNRLNDKIDSAKYQNVFLFDDLTLEFYLACSLKTAKDITTKLSETMKQLETSGLNTNIRDKWREKMVNLIN